jgi:hypothetical protein
MCGGAKLCKRSEGTEMASQEEKMETNSVQVVNQDKSFKYVVSRECNQTLVANEMGGIGKERSRGTSSANLETKEKRSSLEL